MMDISGLKSEQYKTLNSNLLISVTIYYIQIYYYFFFVTL